MPDTPAEQAQSAKSLLRKALIARRAALGQQRRTAADAVLLKQLLDLPEYQTARTVFTYVSVADEVDTRVLIRSSLVTGKRVCVPRCESFGQMDAVIISSENDLGVGSYGLPEPHAGLPVVAPVETDLIIVPCLAATTTGLRIGYGGGFYDRYLARLLQTTPVASPGQTAPLSVALCRREFLLDELPACAHDVRVDRVLSA
jgi:5-formyltetrahydrofolate cyclo-ligase